MNASYNSFSRVNEFPTNLVDALQYRSIYETDMLGFTFLTEGGGRAIGMTYGELHHRAKAIAAALQERGGSDDRALLLCPPGLDFIAGFFGCLYAGLIAIPAYPPFLSQIENSLPKIQAIVYDATPKCALITTNIRPVVEKMVERAPGLKAIDWITIDSIPTVDGENWRKITAGAEKLAFLQYTSGSTAEPKGVMVSHGNLIHNTRIIQKAFEVTEADRGVSWLPPYHDMGLISGILAPFLLRVPMVLLSPWAFLQRPFSWLKAISANKATITGAPNFAYDLCARKVTPEQASELDLSRLRVAFNGSEPVREDVINRFVSTLSRCGIRKETFYPTYGLAEATMMVTCRARHAVPIVKKVDASLLERNEIRDAAAVTVEFKEEKNVRSVVSCGISPLDQQVIIVDPESLTLSPENKVGEIWVSGDSVAKGYWNQPEQTGYTFQAFLAEGEKRPFLRTGDLGFLCGDELFITGRIKDLIIIDGRNYYPQDIEKTIEASCPFLQSNQAVAFSIDVNGEESLVVAVELSSQNVSGAKTVLQTIRYVVSEFHELKVHSVLLLKEGSIPKTPSGKMKRQACRAAYLERNLGVIDEWNNTLRATTNSRC